MGLFTVWMIHSKVVVDHHFQKLIKFLVGA